MRKGVFFTLDVLLAVIIGIMMVVAINFFLLRVEEDPGKDLYIEKVANDVLFTLVKNGTFNTAQNDSVSLAFNSILPENLGGVLRVDFFQCSDPACNDFTRTGGYTIDTCKTTVVDVILTIDRSGSMDGQKIIDAKDAAKVFVDQLDSNNDRSGVVSFDGWQFWIWGSPDAILENNLTFDKAEVKNSIDAIVTEGGTAMGTGIQMANDHFADDGRASPAIWTQILLSDGKSNRGIDPLVAAADADDKGIIIYAIGLGSDADNATMEQIANMTGGKYFFAPDSGQLNSIYLEIAEDLLKREFEVSLARTSFTTFQGRSLDEFGTAELRVCVI